MTIKNIIFDLGGVVVDIERERCVAAFDALGLENANSYFGDYAQTGIFMQIEDGSVDEAGFHAYLHERLPAGVSDEDIDTAFQRFIIGIPERRLVWLRELRSKGFKLYLLSNTNPIMWKGVLASEFRREGFEREDYFDGMITSFEAKSAKPDREIFAKLLKQNGIEATESLFLDDSEANVAAARALNINAIQVQPGTEFIDYLGDI